MHKNSKADYFHLTFIKKEKISSNVSLFFFNKIKLGSKDKLNFLAGQYVHLYLPVKNERGRGDSRMFTIASSPLEKDHIFIAVKKGKSIFKKALFNLSPNTNVKFFGPSGSLILNDKSNSPYVFLSGGIGITPFRSIIKYASQKKLKIPITLLATFSQKDDLCFYQELLSITRTNKNINVVYLKKRLSKKVLKTYLKKISKSNYFIAGSASMVSSIEDYVYELGVDSEKIFIEDFEGYL